MSEIEHISKPIERVMEKLENKKECTHITDSDLQAISEAHQRFCQETLESVAAKRQPDLKALIDFTSMARGKSSATDTGVAYGMCGER